MRSGRKKAALLHLLVMLPGLTMSGWAAEKIAPPVEKAKEEVVGKALEAEKRGEPVDLPIIRSGLLNGPAFQRMGCARVLAEKGGLDDVPYLIDALSDETSVVGADYRVNGMSTIRYWANVALIAICKTSYDFRWDASQEDRERAIKLWKMHWQKAKPKKVEAKPSFVAKIDSVTRDEKKYKVVVNLTLEADDFKPLQVRRPDEWGMTKFLQKQGEKISVSEDTALQHAGGYSGFVMIKGDSLKFVYEGEVEDDGAIHFDESDQLLPVYARASQLGVRMTLWVSDFSSGKCRVETVDSDWKELDFPFPVAKPKVKKPEELSVPALPEVPR